MTPKQVIALVWFVAVIVLVAAAVKFAPAQNRRETGKMTVVFEAPKQSASNAPASSTPAGRAE
jgi:hypothetical protein